MQPELTRLPIELLQVIFCHAAATQLDTSPRGAAALRLVSREIQKWVLPTIFFVLVVYWPVPGEYSTPSLAFFFHLIRNPSASPRAHVRHVVILHPSSVPTQISSSHDPNYEPWEVDTVAVEGTASIQRLQLLRLSPRRVIIPSTFYGLRDLIDAHWSPSLSAPTVRLKELRMLWPIQVQLPGEAPTEASLQMTHQHAMDIIERGWRSGRLRPVELCISRTLVLQLRPRTESDIRRTVDIVQALLHGPELNIVLALQDTRLARDTGGLARTQHSICTALSAASHGTNNSDRLTVQIEPGPTRPESCLDYVRSLRDGWDANLVLERMSLDKALAEFA